MNAYPEEIMCAVEGVKPYDEDEIDVIKRLESFDYKDEATWQSRYLMYGKVLNLWDRCVSLHDIDTFILCTNHALWLKDIIPTFVIANVLTYGCFSMVEYLIELDLFHCLRLYSMWRKDYQFNKNARYQIETMFELLPITRTTNEYVCFLAYLGENEIESLLTENKKIGGN